MQFDKLNVEIVGQNRGCRKVAINCDVSLAITVLRKRKCQSKDRNCRKCQSKQKQNSSKPPKSSRERKFVEIVNSILLPIDCRSSPVLGDFGVMSTPKGMRKFD